jgi:hypothetical protein
MNVSVFQEPLEVIEVKDFFQNVCPYRQGNYFLSRVYAPYAIMMLINGVYAMLVSSMPLHVQ